MGNYFNELRWKIIRANNLLQFINQVTIETSSWATVGSATDKHQAPTHRLKHYVRAVIESEAWPTVVQLNRKP